MSLIITSLSKDIIIDIVSRLPRRYYPTLCLVSKFFRSLIASLELYATRAVMNRTECFLYVIISLTNNIDGFINRNNHLYTLRRNPNSTNYSLVPITSLPHTASHGSYVAVGSKIFVMGGSSVANTSCGNNALLIDCRFHTTRNLSNMPKEVSLSVSHLFNEKIHVIGNDSGRCPFTPNEKDMDVMVFDIKSETWESRTRQDIAVCNCTIFCQSAVTWDGVGKLHAYDFKRRCWKLVKGVGRFLANIATVPRMVIYDKKVVVLFDDQETDGEKREIWCVVIKVERDQEGEFWGTVEWRGCVLDNGQWPLVTNCSPVDV